MDFSTASKYALSILAWIAPYCTRIEVAGSIRRNRPVCNDIDIVCIPKITEEKDMLGTVIGRTNHCLAFLQKYVMVGTTSTASPSPRSADFQSAVSPVSNRPRFISGGDREGKQLILQLPKCQLDLWFACDRTFASRLLMRTGSKEHNIWFAERAADHRLHWFPYYGLAPEAKANHTGEQIFQDGHILPATTEADLYKQVRLNFIPPEHRESTWLTKNLEFGLPV